MATTDGLPPDALTLLRASIESSQPPILTINADATSSADTTESLAEAEYLVFNPASLKQDGTNHISIPLTQPTRFIFKGIAVDLRTIYFYHLNRERASGDVINLFSVLNSELRNLGKEGISNLPFTERLGLHAWLSGSVGPEGNEYIRPLSDNAATKAEARDAAAITKGGEDVEMRDAGLSDTIARKKEEERLKMIYALERKMGDRNTILRGHKPQDFSGVRKHSATFLSKSRPAVPAANQPPTTTSIRPAVKPASNKRVEPIILLSPSASSLIRMSNAKSFLQDGMYTVPDAGDTLNLLQLTRSVPAIDDKRAMRFVLVDSPDNFRPDYWPRVVAVFTTGQAWQFKNYKWQTPAELFSHALGVYVGWKGDGVPDSVKGWGRGVLSIGLDKGQRWRDREVVEEVWSGIEQRMKAQGWNRDGPRA